jgi:hypothetical protein
MLPKGRQELDFYEEFIFFELKKSAPSHKTEALFFDTASNPLPAACFASPAEAKIGQPIA